MRRLLLVALLLVAGCASGSHDRRLTVFAAASLTDAFTDLGAEFERTHPGVSVRMSFAGSQSLVAQLREGAPADVLATADQASMALVEQARDPQVFARNQLAVVVPHGRPVPTLAQLARPSLKVVLGGPTVPVGRATRAALARAGVTVRPVSEEPDVRSVLAKVTTGEADAAVVYATDLAAAGDAVSGTVLPGAVTSLSIARLSANPDAAEFVAFVLDRDAQELLALRGFSPP